MSSQSEIDYLNQIKNQNLNQISANNSNIVNMQSSIALTTDSLNAQITLLQNQNTDLSHSNMLIDDIISKL